MKRFMIWLQRSRTKSALHQLDDRLLRDLGIGARCNIDAWVDSSLNK